MSRRALIRKRCTSCGATIPDKICPKGHRRSTWSFTVDVNPSGAPRKQLTRSGFSTKVEAQRALDEFKIASSRGEYVEPSRLTVGAYIDERWIPAVQARLRPSTFESYQRNLRLHVLPGIGDVRLQALQPTDLNALYAILLKSGRRNGPGGGLSGRTVRYVHSILRKALSDAERWSLVVRNVADLADPPPTRSTRPPKMHTWTSDEVRAFLEHVRRDRLAAMWVMFVTTGMRRGEVLGLSWSETNLDRGDVSIIEARVTVGHDVVVSEPKTPRSRRRIAIDPQTVVVLRDWRKLQLEYRLRWGSSWQDCGLVFTREDGSALHPDAVSGLFERQIEAAGLPRIRLHDLRHTWASLALQQGVPLKVVSERLGHSSISITADTYQHVTEGMDRDAADRVAQVLFR